LQFLLHSSAFKSGEQALGYKEAVNTYRLWKPETVVAQIDVAVTRYGVKEYQVRRRDLCAQSRTCSSDLRSADRTKLQFEYLGLCPRRYRTIGPRGQIEAGRHQLVVFWVLRRAVLVSATIRIRGSRRRRCSKRWTVFDRRYSRDGNYLFGLPEDDQHTCRKLSISPRVEIASSPTSTARCLSRLCLVSTSGEGGLAAAKTWSGYFQHAADTLPLPTRHITGTDVLRFRDQAFDTYFSNSATWNMIDRRSDHKPFNMSKT